MKLALRIALLGGFVFFTVSVNAYTLHQALQEALADSPDLQRAYDTHHIAQTQLKQAYSHYLPSVEVGGIYHETRHRHNNHWSITASQNLFQGFGTYHDVKAYKALVSAQGQRVQEALQTVIYQVIEAFLELSQRQELLTFAQQQVREHEQIYRRIQRRIEAGVGRQADLFQMDARLALAQGELVGFNAQLQNAKARFRYIVGSLPLEPLQLPVLPLIEKDRTIQEHPLLCALTKEIEAAKQRRQLMRANFTPRVDLQLGSVHRYRHENTATVQVSWNVFKGGKDYAKSQEAALYEQTAKYAYQQAYRHLSEQCQLMWNAYESALNQQGYLKTHVQASIQTQQAYLKQFSLGNRTLLDLLDSEKELFRARLRQVEGKYALIKSSYGLLKAQGILKIESN